MKRLIIYSILIVVGITLVGCSSTAKEIRMKSLSERTDVFSEIKEEGVIPEGFADLIIKASIKTHLEGYYIGESKNHFTVSQNIPF